MTVIKAEVILDSLHPDSKKRLTTMLLTYPRFIHSELMTHRVFSRNASSSRAIPILKMIQKIIKIDKMALPDHWGLNQPGMQSDAYLTGWRASAASLVWISVGYVAIAGSYILSKLGVHKQWANRITEPWQNITVLVSSTEWDNFFELRDHDDAQPEFQQLAKEIKRVMGISQPYQVEIGEWHLPYVTVEDVKHIRNLKKADPQVNVSDLLRRISTARCARTSYLTVEGKKPTLEQDLKLFERLVGSHPKHMSPAEHQAQAITTKIAELPQNRSNLTGGWLQFRRIL